jgi:protein TonB
MFDLVAGKAVHIPQKPFVPMVVSIAAQATAVTVLVVIPILFVTDQLPAPSTMMAFVAAAPPPPPPPPPPAPAPDRAESAKPVPTMGDTAPVEEPSRLEPEPPAITDVGLPGGVEGGIVGGVVGGIVDGFEIEAPPPAPPPPTRLPIRTGGKIQPPALVKRIEPIYPDIAVRAHIEGTVILEAVVDENGRVESVKVLRSIGVLDRAAMEAVQQWVYEPLTLNGTRTPFILTVVLTFKFTEA